MEHRDNSEVPRIPHHPRRARKRYPHGSCRWKVMLVSRLMLVLCICIDDVDGKHYFCISHIHILFPSLQVTITHSQEMHPTVGSKRPLSKASGSCQSNQCQSKFVVGFCPENKKWYQTINLARKVVVLCYTVVHYPSTNPILLN